MSKSVPDRWLKYKPYGNVIAGTRIMAFKVPLKESIARNLQPGLRFTPAMLVSAFPTLKFIVDLTNTTRYYEPGEFVRFGIKYQKVMIPGQQVPTMEYVKKFYKAIETFSKECTGDDVIGVHCTHGLNRTGYLICRYLIQQLGWTRADAVKAFNAARGHSIERQNYLTDLEGIPEGKRVDVSDITLEVIGGSKNAKARAKRQKARNLVPPPQIPPFGPMGPRGPMGPPPHRAFVNGGPFPPPPPPPRFGPPPRGAFGPHRGPRMPPPLGHMMPPPPQHLPPPLFGPRSRFGGMPPPQQMRSPPHPPAPLIPPPPGPMHMQRRHLSLMGRPVPPPPPSARRPPPLMPPRMGPAMRARLGPIPPSGVPSPTKVKPNAKKGAKNKKAGAGAAKVKNANDMDFTQDTFEENLLTTGNQGVQVGQGPKKNRKRPFAKKR